MKLAIARIGLALVLALSAGLAHAQALPPQPLIWKDFTLDFQIAGQISSIAVEPGGRPHIAYRDLLTGQVRYGRRNNNNSWSVFTIDTGNTIGWGISLALDAANNPHFSYYKGPGPTSLGALVFAKGTCTPVGAAAACSFSKTVIESNIQDPSSGNNTSIALDPTGAVHIAYVDNANAKVKWARRLAGSTTWDITNVVTVPGAIVSLAIDANNFPTIAFSDQATGQVKFVSVFCQFILCGWSFEIVDGSGDMPAMRRAADGKVHVVYRQGGTIRYALRSGSTWSLQTVGSAGAAGFFPGIALDSAGAPHITFVRNLVGVGELMYARRRAFPNGWNLEVADFDVASSVNSSIAVDANGVRNISCGGASDQSMRHLSGTVPPPPVLQQ